MRHLVNHPDPRRIFGTQSGRRKAFRLVADRATDKQAELYYKGVKQKIRSARLGRLEGAVGRTSSLKLRKTTKDAFGVVFSRGGRGSRADEALFAYSTGVTIRIRNKQWLAYQTNAVPRRAGPGRQRMTPELYRKFGFEQSLGKLIFKPLGRSRAVLVVRNVSLNAKTGRARPLKRRTRARVPMKETVVFFLLKSTIRNKRVDAAGLARLIASKGPDLHKVEMDKLLQRPNPFG